MQEAGKWNNASGMKLNFLMFYQPKTSPEAI